MLTKDKINAILRENYAALVSEYGVKRIGLFGSYAKGQANETSDVDLVVEFQRPIGLRFISLAKYLEHILGKKVDLLTPTGIADIKIPKIAKDIEENIIYV